MNEELQPRVDQVKKAIEDIDKVFRQREYSRKEIQNFLKDAKKLVDDGRIRFGNDGEITHFPETSPFIVEMILALCRGIKKIELMHLENKLAWTEKENDICNI